MNDVREPDAPATLAGVLREPLPVSRLLRGFALTADIEGLIDACLAELRLVIPLLHPWRGLHSGSRVLGAHTEPLHGEPLPSGVTRVDIEFFVKVTQDAAGHAATLTCRSTIRGRDQETTHARFALDGHGTAHIGAWVEDALLVFAARWFEARHAGAQAIRARRSPSASFGVRGPGALDIGDHDLGDHDGGRHAAGLRDARMPP